MSDTARGLKSLPEELMVDEILPLLPNTDLNTLRLTSQWTRRLVDDDLLWRRKVTQDLNVPPHASARVTGWQSLYRALFRPSIHVCGDWGNGRTGLGEMPLSSIAARIPASAMVNDRWGGFPFPVMPDMSRINLKLSGSPVRIVASGWAFHVLTTAGLIIHWGTYDGEAWDSEETGPGYTHHTPFYQEIPDEEPIRDIGCGRKHVAAITRSGKVLEWNSSGEIATLDGWAPDAEPTHDRILELAVGWCSTAVLLLDPLSSKPATTSSRAPSQPRGRSICWWRNDWTAAALEHYRDNAPPHKEGDSEHCVVSAPSVRLPDLPSAPAGVFGTETRAHQTISQIALADRYIFALTDTGLIYSLDLASPLPGGIVGQENEESNRPEAERKAYRNRLRSPDQWQFLPQFCVPSAIRKDTAFEQPALSALLTPDTRITHISAALDTFAAYSVPPPASTSTQEPNSRSGVALIADLKIPFESRPPTVLPELQGRSIVKISLGDYHWGALTADGEVLTWGQWSKGALGIWDTLPTVGGPPQPATTPRLPPLLRVGHAGRGVSSPNSSVLANIFGGRATTATNVSERRQALYENFVANALSTTEAAQSEEELFAPREHPSRVDAPTRVPLRGKYAFDIALAGWHTGILAVNQTDMDGGAQREDESSPKAATASADEPPALPTPAPLTQPTPYKPTRTTTAQLPTYTPTPELSTAELHRIGTRLLLCSILGGALLAYGLLGGWEAGHDRDGSATWLAWPHNLAYLIPLLVPLGTYLVIARWTGYNYYRHA